MYEKEFGKTLEKIVEYLLSGEKIDENFGLFCEYQMMEKIITLSKRHKKNINIIIIKNFGVLIPSLQDNKIMFYFFSNNYMNQIINNISYNIEEQDNDYLSYYINFLKTIANKLEVNTLSLFFHIENNNFPLLDEASVFFNNQDVMIKNTSRNIFLSIIQLNYKPMIQYICDIPRITDFLLLTDNIKLYIIMLINNINSTNANKIIKIKEIEESLIDDILFIQDILSVGIIKINYIITNCLFSIPLKYLFNCILTHTNSYIAFYVLNLFMKNIKNECILNLISFVLYSSVIHQRINESFSTEESSDIYNLLYLNKQLYNLNKNTPLSIDQYISLIYSENFLKSIRYMKVEDKNFIEIKAIINTLRTITDVENDVSCNIKLLSKILQTKNISNIINLMENYHNFLSKTTGINIGVSHNKANNSFLKIIYDNLQLYSNNNNKILQSNILKKECFYFIDFSNNNDNSQFYYLNEIFLMHQIISNNNISYELKKFLCLNGINNPSLSNKESTKISRYSSNSDENLLSISKEPQDNMRKRNNKINQSHDSSNSNGNSINSLESDNNNIKNISTNNNYYDFIENKIKDENNNIIMLPKPICNTNTTFDKESQLILDKKVIKFDDMNFNVKMFDNKFKNYNKIFFSKDIEKNANLSWQSYVVDKIMSLLFSNDNEKILSKIVYKLSFEILENLIMGSKYCDLYKNKYHDIINNNYLNVLNKINDILLKSNSSDKKIFKNAYFYFEESFQFHKKKFISILNEYYNSESTILLINSDNSNLNVNSEGFNIFKIPKKECELFQCLLQMLIGLHDLKIIISENEDNLIDYSITLFRNKEFPLSFIKSGNEIGNIVDIYSMKFLPTEVQYKTKFLSKYENYLMYLQQNYIFFVIQLKDDNSKYIIKQKFPLRQIVLYSDRGDPRTLTLYILNEKNDYEVTLQFDGIAKAMKTKDSIDNAVKRTILMEFSAVKGFINKLINSG